MQTDWQTLSREAFCYLTTTGRVSGRAHTIEIWFALNDKTLYMLSGGRDRADWVRNAQTTPAVQVRISGQNFVGQARLVRDAEEDALARKLVYEKYAGGDEDLDDWAATSLPLVVDLSIEQDS